jgi:hypothetical protein
LGYLFINELGNTPDAAATNFGPFTTLNDSGVYWSSTPVADNPPLAWYFYAGYDGEAGSNENFSPFSALAVRSG